MPRQALAWGVFKAWVARYAEPNWRSASAKVAMLIKNDCLRYTLGKPANKSSGSTSLGGLNCGLMRCR